MAPQAKHLMCPLTRTTETLQYRASRERLRKTTGYGHCFIPDQLCQGFDVHYLQVFCEDRRSATQLWRESQITRCSPGTETRAAEFRQMVGQFRLWPRGLWLPLGFQFRPRAYPAMILQGIQRLPGIRRG